MQSLCVSVLGLLCLCGIVLPHEIDNHLAGPPVVDCMDTTVSLTFNTEKAFNGRVFVRGLADDDRCSRNFATNADQSKFSMVIANGDCAMQRQRVASESLEGVMFSLVIVVSFHGTFVTKSDRAFRCMCFFRNIKRVTNFLDISQIGTTELLDTAKMPTCTYTIRTGSPSGELLRYAKVSDKIFHVWECDDKAQGFLVHSCWVNDGRGNRFDLLDIDGCAIDPIIQPDIKYEESLQKAYVETWGYKFSDTSVLNYQCVVELCKIAQGECKGLVPPNCGKGKKRRDTSVALLTGKVGGKGRRDHTNAEALDLVANVDVLDTLEADLGTAGPSPDLLKKLNQFPQVSRMDQLEPQHCFSSFSFALIMGIMGLLFICAFVSSIVLLMKSRSQKC